MKILVISDTHGNIEHVKKVLDQTLSFGVGVVLHCGDYISDARLIQKFYPQVEVYGVYGNCDVGFGGEYSTVVTIEGVSIYMTHGHRYGVKWGEYDDLLIDTVAHAAQIGICGHSHCAYLNEEQGVWLLNPGSITLPRDSKSPSYAIIEVENGYIKDINVLQILDTGTVRRHPETNIYRIK